MAKEKKGGEVGELRENKSRVPEVLEPHQRVNPFGHVVNWFEKTDPVPMRSKVVFKRPMSAAERVQRALKNRELIRAMDSGPGDESFDGPDYENMTPHQLMIDPQTGEEMTAGEHVMLQAEREQARQDVETARQIRARREQEKLLRKQKNKKPEVEEREDSDDDGE